jgi:phosphoribosylformylglycinamidine synthase
VRRIGVTEAGGPAAAAVEVQDSFTIPLDELREANRAPMRDHFGPVVGQR